MRINRKVAVNLVLRLLEICTQNQGNSVSGDLECKHFLGGLPPDPPRRDWLQPSITTIRLLRNFCQLLQKLWTTLYIPLDTHYQETLQVDTHRQETLHVVTVRTRYK